MKTLLKSIITLLLVGFIGTSFAKEPEYAQDSSYQQGFVQVDQGRLYFEVVGQGIPIIVLHGGPGLDQGYLRPQLLTLAANHKLIFYDQRGSGRSLDTLLDEKHINIHQFVEDLERLRKSLCLDKFVLMGHSWGGLLGMQYAIEHQDHLLGLILLNTAPADYKGQKAFLEEFEARTKNIHSELKPLFAYDDFKKLDAIQISTLYRKLFSVYFYDPNRIEELTLNFSIASAQSGFKVNEEMTKTFWLNPNVDLFPSLKNLTVPTFVLHSRQDIVPVWTAEEIKKAIPGAEIVILENSDHFPYIEQPSQFFIELNKFLYKINDKRSRTNVKIEDKQAFN